MRRGELETSSETSTEPLSVVRADAETETGAESNFTGQVTVGPLFTAPGDARLSGGVVTFEPGAYTAWHTHPLGQTLHITAGCALVQSEGHEVIAAGPGDIVLIPAGVRHWHGATANESMTHFAILESLNGTGVTWMEKLAPEAYPETAGCD